jgi:hypothetical protein
MVTEDQMENPSAGGADGLGKGQSQGSEDRAENKPNDAKSQDDFDFAAFETELHGEPAKPNGGAAAIFSTKRKSPACTNNRVVASWVYTDEHGVPLYKVDRVETGEIGPNGKPKKTFKQSRSDGHGGRISSSGYGRRQARPLPAARDARGHCGGEADFHP